jgi:hypothetical protein
MRENPKVSSFEPRRLRDAIRELERIEASIEINSPKKVSRSEPAPRPGILVRWWRHLFGGGGI